LLARRVSVERARLGKIHRVAGGAAGDSKKRPPPVLSKRDKRPLYRQFGGFIADLVDTLVGAGYRFSEVKLMSLPQVVALVVVAMEREVLWRKKRMMDLRTAHAASPDDFTAYLKNL